MQILLESYSNTKHGQDSNYSGMFLIILLMTVTSFHAIQLEGLKWEHPVVSLLCILTARIVFNQQNRQDSFFVLDGKTLHEMKHVLSQNLLVQHIFFQLSEKSFQCSNKYTALSKVYKQCIPSLDVDEEVQYNGWCYTRKHLNDSAIRGQFGYCDSSCRGMKSNTNVLNSVYNLANGEHSDLWNENIFMLKSLSSGHCHTYNPENYSLAGNRGQFYAMLGMKLNLFLK